MKAYNEFYGKSEILNMQHKYECGEGGALTWLWQTQRSIAVMDQTGIGLNAVLEWNLGSILGIGMALETALNLRLHPTLTKIVKENEIDEIKG